MALSEDTGCLTEEKQSYLPSSHLSARDIEKAINNTLDSEEWHKDCFDTDDEN